MSPYYKSLSLSKTRSFHHLKLHHHRLKSSKKETFKKPILKKEWNCGKWVDKNQWSATCCTTTATADDILKQCQEHWGVDGYLLDNKHLPIEGGRYLLIK